MPWFKIVYFVLINITGYLQPRQVGCLRCGKVVSIYYFFFEAEGQRRHEKLILNGASPMSMPLKTKAGYQKNCFEIVSEIGTIFILVKILKYTKFFL